MMVGLQVPFVWESNCVPFCNQIIKTIWGNNNSHLWETPGLLLRNCSKTNLKAVLKKKKRRMFEGLSHYLLFLFSLPFFKSFSSVTKYPPLHNISCFSHGCKQFSPWKETSWVQTAQSMAGNAATGGLSTMGKKRRFCHFWLIGQL